MKTAIFLLLLLLLPGGGAGRSEGYQSPGMSVKISILSKQMRLIREKEEGSLVFYSYKPFSLYDLSTGNHYNTRSIKLTYEQGLWKIYLDEIQFMGEYNILVKKTGKTGLFKIRIGNKLRRYPLPLSITRGRRDPRITVTESIARYSFDSAAAEYGGWSPCEYEAVDALTRIIAARSMMGLKNPRHKGYHFCDLTHCQVYRGRTGRKRSAMAPFFGRWRIDLKSLKNPLLFHSSCGGMTFGPELFTSKPHYKYKGIKDILYRENILLCVTGSSYWKRTLLVDEVFRILKLESCFPERGRDLLDYDRTNLRVKVRCGERRMSYPPENFRIRINRVKGWNFLKSNNYTVERGKGPGQLIFKGYGLGHGSGFCQVGALELSRKGYSASEIIQHYYPDLKLVSLTGEDDRSYNISYALFDLFTGRTKVVTSPSLMNRKFPPGSLWKLVTSLYLARERQDLLRDYRYYCTGKRGDNPHLPERCWKRGGHGNLDFKSALSGSCNLYFASLFRVINFRRYREFVEGLFRDLHITAKIPGIKTREEKARFLAGLDFRISFGIKDLIKIVSLVQPVESNNRRVRKIRNSIPLSARNSIMEALYGTLINGTAAFDRERENPGQMKNRLIFSKKNTELINEKCDGIWGKTSTVIDGTNRPESYGIFLGAYETEGIILFLKNSSGHNAAKWGKILLLDK